MDTFIRLCSKFGRKEASCLAIALHRNASILTDDLDARRFAQQGSISVSGSDTETRKLPLISIPPTRKPGLTESASTALE